MSANYKEIFNTPKLKIDYGRTFSQIICWGKNKNQELGFENI